MKTSEKLSRSRGYISQSLPSDLSAEGTALTAALSDWKAPAAILAGGFLLRKFPKATLLGLLTAGVYVGYTIMNRQKEKNPLKGVGLANLH